ncbi:transglutaminase-like enzyme, predicted cysteine protease [Echinicola vietnamensis DSM 17526]|uniref:Transglutaminase-like enzyme, predicted cysteine protease n=2 Tax=Echinicola TaxID=390846 RepID=L0FX24_ECHVK|nr:transglutaminase-like enzyme, predicted cysteine protease [Echinicola vietnamensis DSM 17526]
MIAIFDRAWLIPFSLLLWTVNFAAGQGMEEVKLINSKINSVNTIRLTEDYEVFLREKNKILILNEDGLKDGNIWLSYSDLLSIEDFEGEITDPQTGKTIEKLKLKHFKDVSHISEGSVFEDDRLKYYKPSLYQFPVEITYEYTQKIRGNMYFPSWTPEGKPKQLVEQNVLEVIYPEKLGLRYKTENIATAPNITKDNGEVRMKWMFENLFNLDDPEEDSVALVKIAPKAFSMEGYAADMSTWNGFGMWVNQLLAGRAELSPQAKSTVGGIVDSLETDREKIKALYRYLQGNYRYVSIQMGIGGLQPVYANEVFEKKYGDCKGLTFLMKSMLQEAGIAANYTLVQAGSDEDDIDTGFPSNQFNHVILQVPVEQDTLWLECTSNTLPAGFLGDFTMDRHVLAITDEGGVLLKTPCYDAIDYNQIKNVSKVNLLGNGMARIHQAKELTGFAAQNYLYAQSVLNEKDIQKYLYHDLGLSGAHIEDFELRVDGSKKVPTAELNHDTFLQQFYQSTSKRMIITPKFQSVDSDLLGNRFMKWEERWEILNEESVELESGGDPVQLSEDFFDYAKEIQFADNTLTVVRTVNFHFPESTDRDTMDKALKKIAQLDNQPIFLRK